MIVYFTGTGNSRYAAEVIAEVTKDEIVSLNDVIKNNLTKKFRSEKPFVIIAPIYAWRFPRVVEQWLLDTAFEGNKNMYFVGTMQSQSGNCDNYLKKICDKRGMQFKGYRGVAMPNNYIIGSDVPNDKTVKVILKDAILVLKEIAKEIVNLSDIVKTDKTPASWLLSGLVNKSFYRFVVSSKNYVVSDSCISCGKCADICPVNNITMIQGKPKFEDHCISCLACIHSCPVAAVNIKGKTENRGRYLCPKYIP